MDISLSLISKSNALPIFTKIDSLEKWRQTLSMPHILSHIPSIPSLTSNSKDTVAFHVFLRFLSFPVLFREAIFSFADFHCFTSWSYSFAINQFGAESSAKFVSRRFNFSITGAISLLMISLNCSNTAILNTRNTLKPLKTTSYGHHIQVSLSAIWLPNNT